MKPALPAHDPLDRWHNLAPAPRAAAPHPLACDCGICHRPHPADTARQRAALRELACWALMLGAGALFILLAAALP